MKMYVENMERDHFEFGKPKNENVSIDSKTASAILRCIPLAIETGGQELMLRGGKKAEGRGLRDEGENEDEDENEG